LSPLSELQLRPTAGSAAGTDGTAMDDGEFVSAFFCSSRIFLLFALRDSVFVFGLRYVLPGIF